MLSSLQVFVASVLFTAVAAAQITDGGIVNAAGFMPEGLPTGSIAQGSVMTVFGENLADPGTQVARSFPLSATMGGTTAQVSSGGVTLDCPMIFTTPGQIAVLLPSATQVGRATLTLRRSSGVEFRAEFEVTVHSPGLYTLAQNGTGPGIFTNFISQESQPVNGIRQAAAIGQVVTAWLTGAGAVAGNEAGGPLPGALPYGVRVFINDVEVTNILYFGRSGCCAGLDQLVFEVPPGVAGCFASLQIVVEGVPSNPVGISIGPNGVCEEAVFFSPEQLRFLTGVADRLRLAEVSLSRFRTENRGPGIGGPLVEGADDASATFHEFTSAQLSVTDAAVLAQVGGCTAVGFASEGIPSSDTSVTGRGLDAGPSILLTTPAGGDVTMTPDFLGDYGGPGGFRTLAPPPFGGVPFLDGTGLYTATILGGADIGEYQSAMTVSAPGLLEFTNKDQIAAVDRTRDLRVEWQVADPNLSVVLIDGSAFDVEKGAEFFCFADPRAGFFDVPARILGLLPPSGNVQGNDLGTLSVSGARVDNVTPPSGADSAVMVFFSAEQISGLPYR